MYYESNDSLTHYGVKGMKWGVVKSAVKATAPYAKKAAKRYGGRAVMNTVSKASNSKVRRRPNKWEKDSRRNRKIDRKISRKVGDLNSDYQQKQARQDYSQLGKKGVRNINRKLNEGKSYEKAYLVETGKQAAKGFIKSAGGRAVATVAVSVAAKAAVEYVISRSDIQGLPKLESGNIIDLKSNQYKVL